MATSKKPGKSVMSPPVQTNTLLLELRGLIDAARQQVAQTANAALTLLYWHVGQRIRHEVLKNERAEYGSQIMSTMSTQLVAEYGQAFGERSLRRMVQFAEVFPDEDMVATLAQQLSWSHFIEILPLKQPLEREYYAELCRVERWSVRILRERIASQLYLRTAIAKLPEAVVKAEIDHLRTGGQMTADLVFRDPYMLDFLGLPQDYSERDLEDAILREMELYLRWLDKHDRAAGEEAPIGLILCATRDAEQVKLMDMEASNIRVAEYLAHIPDMQVLQTQLHRAVGLARERVARGLLPGE